MNVRAVCTGELELPLPAAEALELFTPEGERAWAGPGWNPVYPVAAEAADCAAPGTVFTTESTGGDATWIVLERSAGGYRYARVVPGRLAGTIAVECAPAAGGCRVTVTYDATSLGPEGAAFVRELEAGYDAFLAGWREEILAHLARR
jgi:hypothetical protein